MKFKPMILEKVPNQDAVVTINRTGIYFSAMFIKTHGLENHEAVSFHIGSEDPYILGFDFHTESGAANSLMLARSGRKGTTAGRMVKASEHFSSHLTLKKISTLENKAQRKFEVRRDKESGFYFITLRPSFERTLPFDETDKLPDNVLGIYRYLHNGEVAYIGEGRLKDRAKDHRKAGWPWDKYEYSIVDDKETVQRLEAQYINEHEQQYGVRPRHNKQSGRNFDK